MKLLANTRLLISLFLIVGLCINEFTYCQNQNDDEEEETNQDETNQDEESSGNGATGGNDEVASNNQLQIKTEKIIATTRQAAPKKVTVAVNLDEPVTDQQALDDISDSNEDEDTNDDNETNDEEEDSNNNNNNNNNNNEQEQEVEQIKQQQQPVDVPSTVVTPPFKSSRSKLLSIISKPGILAGIVGGAIIGILTAILLIMFIVYRMRKKDEGSYALEETKKPLNAYDYRHCPTKEFYA
jgi:hypothetical protein